MRRGLALAALAMVAGCTPPKLSDVALPGGAPSGPAYRVTAEFTDVLDLVPQAAVKVNDVTVGSVEKVWLSGWTARVKLKIDKKLRLPDNTTAALRQTSLLGEKFVALAPPDGEAAQGTLGDGDVIPVARTRRSAEVEEVLAALGLLLNGGGLAQLKTINVELAKAFQGREPAAHDVLTQLDTFIGSLDTQKGEIVRAVDALDRLSGKLAAQRTTVGAAIDALDPGLTVLAQQRAQLTAALTALADLGTVGTRVIDASRADTVASLQALQPILASLVRAGDSLPKALDFLLTYPFPPNVTNAVVGDFVNLRVTMDLDATTILANLLAAPAGPGAAGLTAPVPQVPAPQLPTVPQLPGVPAVPGLPGVPTLPGAPGSPGLPCLPLTPGVPLPTLLPLPTLTPCPTPSPGAAGGTDHSGLLGLLTGRSGP
jgi:phospholipid/cholesterol/gamma-HCH transport system substrate-binding protein